MKTIIVTFAALVTMAGIFASVTVGAQEPSAPMTDSHITRIKNNCQSVSATLSQLHANDGPVFVNRNQAYFSISDKLIARLNSRLALNRFDTSSMVTISNEYNIALVDFRSNFKEYDEAMKELLKINCNRQPVGFYDKVAEVKQLRGIVNESVNKIHASIDEYRRAVTTFQEQQSSRLGGQGS